MKQALALAIASLGLAVATSAAEAQSNTKPPARTPETVSACIALDRVIKDMQARIDRDQRWIRENRGRNSVSRDYFNQRVDESNGQVNARNVIVGDYNANCAQMLTSVVKEVCSRRQAQMNKYIYDAPICVRSRSRQ